MARRDVEIRYWQPTGERMLWLAGATVMVVAPHIARVPIWLSLGFVILAVWAVGASFGRWPRAGKFTQFLVSLSAPLGVLWSYGTLLGRDAGVALLVILAACKLIETRALRDAYVTAFVAFFLIITNFLFSQSMFTGVYMLLVVVVIISALLAINDRDRTLTHQRILRTAGTMVIQAAPLMIALFVLFPRLPGPLWGLPKDARAGVSKLGNSMSPGNISQLSLSDAVAFRVQFEGPSPPSNALYWRGPVLWRTDGQEWTTLNIGHVETPPFTFAGRSVTYTMTVEPHYERWLFALDMPAEIPPGATMTGDYQLRSARPVRNIRKYRLRSYPSYSMPMLDPEEREYGLQLPVGYHPQARRLARRWLENAKRTLGPSAPVAVLSQALVDRALHYFREQPFYYTLRPPLLNEDTVDEFLFVTRRGFCEFYASAFTILMRAAGVPARVVTGYQGGEFNPIGEYLIVRQRDAHAWAEVWLEGHGWVRVDPTAAVSPDRIERGVDAALPPPLGTSALGIALGLAPGGELAQALRALRHSWDTVNNAWNQWVVDYGEKRQRRLLDRFGIDIGDWRTVALALLIVGASVLAGCAWWLTRCPRVSDRALRAYLMFCRKLHRRGLRREPHEGPQAFATRVSQHRPELGIEVLRITGLYLGLRYAGENSDHALGELKAEVARFRP